VTVICSSWPILAGEEVMGLTIRKTKARLWKNFLRIRLIKHWSRLPGEVMTSLSVKVFKMTLLNICQK